MSHGIPCAPSSRMETQMVSKMAMAAILLLAGPTAAAEVTPTTPIVCSMCEGWNRPQKPFKIYGNTWYVGTNDLSALLVTSPNGHVLLDGALPQSAPLIEANIQALGFKLKDVKLILNSHEHFDHAGGIPALQRASGATVAASIRGAKVLRAGTVGKDDPQFDPVKPFFLAKLEKVREVADGETLTAGDLRITAHYTPGHTPGGTSWTWTSCENGRCLNMVYADSLTPVSSEGFRFSGGNGAPDISSAFQATIDKVAALKCDVMVSNHPGFSQVMEKLAARTDANNTFIDPTGCRKYAAAASKRLANRLATEAKQKAAR
uniref:subclass B3 metallo-beta-lactamase ALG6-1 n=1 Tax=uncultured bacterium TaxID=77133 RepID=UPI000949C328|nr:subclass B3 metallo-beta-lactamase ALG6-1 [uncultured bacterium]APR64488.1 carbapenem-hydrolyzing metallo-beta-lactamase ALG6-1 [uncultured bacterium]